MLTVAVVVPVGDRQTVQQNVVRLDLDHAVQLYAVQQHLVCGPVALRHSCFSTRKAAVDLEPVAGDFEGGPVAIRSAGDPDRVGSPSGCSQSVLELRKRVGPVHAILNTGGVHVHVDNACASARERAARDEVCGYGPVVTQDVCGIHRVPVGLVGLETICRRLEDAAA